MKTQETKNTIKSLDNVFKNLEIVVDETTKKIAEEQAKKIKSSSKKESLYIYTKEELEEIKLKKDRGIEDKKIFSPLRNKIRTKELPQKINSLLSNQDLNAIKSFYEYAKNRFSKFPELGNKIYPDMFANSQREKDKNLINLCNFWNKQKFIK